MQERTTVVDLAAPASSAIIGYWFKPLGALGITAIGIYNLTKLIDYMG